MHPVNLLNRTATLNRGNSCKEAGARGELWRRQDTRDARGQTFVPTEFFCFFIYKSGIIFLHTYYTFPNWFHLGNKSYLQIPLRKLPEKTEYLFWEHGWKCLFKICLFFHHTKIEKWHLLKSRSKKVNSDMRNILIGRQTADAISASSAIWKS